MVIISGGVSVGPHDHVKPALAALGVEEVFWCVALQPGKPTWFGLLGRTRRTRPSFGLPGNPVSAVVTFSLFVAPALAALQGGPAPRPPTARPRSAVDVKRNPRRDQAVRVRLELGAPTRPLAAAFPTGAQGSHILTSLLGADALAMIPMGEGLLPAGTPWPSRRSPAEPSPTVVIAPGTITSCSPPPDRSPPRCRRSPPSPAPPRSFPPTR